MSRVRKYWEAILFLGFFILTVLLFVRLESEVKARLIAQCETTNDSRQALHDLIFFSTSTPITERLVPDPETRKVAIDNQNRLRDYAEKNLQQRDCKVVVEEAVPMLNLF